MRIPVGRVSVALEEKGDRICAYMREGASFEPETLAVWGALCLASKGRTVIDVGCYSGLFAISAAMLGCQVHGFEPMPRNAARICANATMNGVEFAVHEMALSDLAGQMLINYNRAVIGLTSGASIVNAQLGKQTIDALPVDVRTLDSFEFQDVAAIKIDVERAEPHVLLGARETLARCKPTLIVEVLGAEEEAAVLAAIDGYQVAQRLDQRNWLMAPS